LHTVLYFDKKIERHFDKKIERHFDKKIERHFDKKLFFPQNFVVALKIFSS